MAMSLIWAPENTLRCIFLFAWYPIFLEIRVFVMVVFFLGFQILVRFNAPPGDRRQQARFAAVVPQAMRFVPQVQRSTVPRFRSSNAP